MKLIYKYDLIEEEEKIHDSQKALASLQYVPKLTNIKEPHDLKSYQIATNGITFQSNTESIPNSINLDNTLPIRTNENNTKEMPVYHDDIKKNISSN